MNYKPRSNPSQAVRCLPGQTPRTLSERLCTNLHTDSNLKSTRFADMLGKTVSDPSLAAPLLSLILLVVVGAIATLSISKPEAEVKMQYHSGKCIAVIRADGKLGDCNDLPEEYSLTWVR